MSTAALPGPRTQPLEISAQDLQGLLRIILKRKGTFTLIFLVVLVAGTLAVMLSKQVYQAQAELLVPPNAGRVITGDPSSPIAGMLAAAAPDPLRAQVRLIQSPAFVSEAVRQAGIIVRPDVVPPTVNAVLLEDENIIEVTVEGGDPQAVTMLANTISDLHVQKTNSLASIGLRATIEFVRKETERAAESLAASERRLLAFREARGGLDLSTEREDRAGEHAALVGHVLELESNIATTRARLADLRGRLAREPLERVQSSAQENPRHRRMQEKLDGLRFERMDLLRQFRPSSRPVQDLDRQIAQMERGLAAEPAEMRVQTHLPNEARPALQAKIEDLEGDLQGYQIQYSRLLGQAKAMKQSLDSLGPWEAELSRLTRERDLVQVPYTALADRMRDLEIRWRAPRQGARVVTRAKVPTVPIWPKKKAGVLLAAALGLMLAAGTVFIQEYLDDRVKTPEELQRLCDLPILGQVPVMQPRQPRLLPALPLNSPITESYLALRSSIGFSAIEAPIRRLLLTSATKGEGKTTTAVNLALAMARDGKRVVLVDADLREPSVHRVLGLSNAVGLSEVLAAMTSAHDALQETDALHDALHDALQETEAQNLRVLTAGTMLPNPTELLGSGAFDRILEHLDQEADIVVLDTAPCTLVVDAVIVAARADGVLLVLRAGETPRAAVQYTLELLGRARARILGVVFNRVPADWRWAYYAYSSRGHYLHS